MRKKRIMIIGPRDCGKTSLANILNCDKGPLRKRQDTIFAENTIDVPSAYVENSWMYMHTIALSQDACCVLVMVDVSRYAEVYSPGFARVFRCPVIGIINKCDLTSENINICEKQLHNTGISEPYFYISSKTGLGIEELEEYLRHMGYMPHNMDNEEQLLP